MTKTAQNTEYAANKKTIDSIQKRLNAVAKTAADAEFKKIQRENPVVADNFNVRVHTLCTKKLPPGYSKVFPKIAECLLWRGWASKKQKEILDYIQGEFPQFKLYASIWNKELLTWQIKVLQKQVDTNMANPIKITGCKTLSDVKKRLVLTDQIKGKTKAIKATLHISDEVVTIGKTLYPITVRKVKSKAESYNYKCIRVSLEGKRQWIRLDILMELLGG